MSGKRCGVISKISTRDNVDLICFFCIEQAKHLPDGSYPDPASLPLFALHQYRFPILAGDEVDAAVNSRTRIAHNGIAIPSVSFTDEIFETAPRQSANAADVRLPHQQLAPSPGSKH
jgi:hypothetical protein